MSSALSIVSKQIFNDPLIFHQCTTDMTPFSFLPILRHYFNKNRELLFLSKIVIHYLILTKTQIHEIFLTYKGKGRQNKIDQSELQTTIGTDFWCDISIPLLEHN